MIVKPEDIDWSQAPQDATHCNIEEYPAYYCWEKASSEEKECHYYWSMCSGSGYEWGEEIFYPTLAHRVQRPVSPSEAPSTKDIQSQLKVAKEALRAAHEALEAIEGIQQCTQ